MGPLPFRLATCFSSRSFRQASNQPPRKEHPGPRTTISGIVQTVEYDNGVSRYYYAVNTTSLLPNRYEIWVWSIPDGPYWEGVSTEFNLSEGNRNTMGGACNGLVSQQKPTIARE